MTTPDNPHRAARSRQDSIGYGESKSSPPRGAGFSLADVAYRFFACGIRFGGTDFLRISTVSTAIVRLVGGVSNAPLQLNGSLALAADSLGCLVAAGKTTESVHDCMKLLTNSRTAGREEDDGVPNSLER